MRVTGPGQIPRRTEGSMWQSLPSRAYGDTFSCNTTGTTVREAWQGRWGHRGPGEPLGSRGSGGAGPFSLMHSHSILCHLRSRCEWQSPYIPFLPSEMRRNFPLGNRRYSNPWSRARVNPGFEWQPQGKGTWLKTCIIGNSSDWEECLIAVAAAPPNVCRTLISSQLTSPLLFSPPWCWSSTVSSLFFTLFPVAFVCWCQCVQISPL